jgi:sorbitol-specific phosphotransferase system component IIA
VPHAAAALALRISQVPPFHFWTPGEAVILCRRNGVKAVQDFKLYRKLGRRPQHLAAYDWEAKAIEFGADRRLVVFRDTGHVGRMVWSIVHELGHILLGHPGAAFNMRTNEWRWASPWQEGEADVFARHVLLPADEVHEFQRKGYDPARIAAAKGVSRKAVRVRLDTMARSGDTGDWAL